MHEINITQPSTRATRHIRRSLSKLSCQAIRASVVSLTISLIWPSLVVGFLAPCPRIPHARSPHRSSCLSMVRMSRFLPSIVFIATPFSFRGLITLCMTRLHTTVYCCGYQDSIKLKLERIMIPASNDNTLPCRLPSFHNQRGPSSSSDS